VLALKSSATEVYLLLLNPTLGLEEEDLEDLEEDQVDRMKPFLQTFFLYVMLK
jgi:hypothetical protein